MFPLVEALLQQQLTLERTNSAVYRSMADALDNEGWDGSAKFMRKSSSDELEHAEELAKKQLRDLINSGVEHVDTERIMPNPLERFLQKEPK